MRTIYKYPLQPVGRQLLPLPEQARILSVGLDPSGNLALWAEVDSENKKLSREIIIAGTGNPLPTDLDKTRFLGSVKDGAFMWHLYELLPKSQVLSP